MSKPWLGLACLPLLLSLGLVSASASVGGCNTAELSNASGSSSSGGTSGASGDDPGSEDPEAGTSSGADGAASISVPTSTNVTIQTEPGDSGKAVHAAIAAAKSSVHMTIYLLTDTSVMNTLGQLKAAGKDVKVVLNKTFPPDGGDNTNAFNKLTQLGVPVVYASSAYTFTHAKSVVIDSAKVLVMTMNLTQNNSNREFIATDGDPADVAAAEQLFAADFAGAAVSIDSKLIVSPQRAQPKDPRTRLGDLMASAKTSLDVEVQALSDTSITGAIVAAHKRGVAVRVVVSGDPGQSDGEVNAVSDLKAAGVPLRGVLTPYIHSKVVVVDGTKVFVGSQNFTVTALTQNREIGVVTDNAVEAKKVDDVIAGDFQAGSPF
ncbi:MAG: phospholipase [Labilithrix sp.]|nr:phospholipase [Labilithrix sp.]